MIKKSSGSTILTGRYSDEISEAIPDKLWIKFAIYTLVKLML